MDGASRCVGSCAAASHGRKRLGRKLLLMLGSTALGLVLAEIALRLFLPQPVSWLAIFDRHARLPFHGHLASLDTTVDTGETRFRILTDARGFRVGEDGGPASPGKQILWIGDSFTFGQGVDYEHSFVGLVDALSGPAVAHLNSGVNGYGPPQYRAVLEDALGTGLHPDVVVVSVFVGNDFHDCKWAKDAPVRDGLLGNSGELKFLVKRHSHLYRFVAARYHRLLEPRGDRYAQAVAQLADEAEWSAGFLAECDVIFRRELQLLASVGAQAGCEVRFVVIPTEDAVHARRAGAKGGEAGTLYPVEHAEQALVGTDHLNLLDLLAAHEPEQMFFAFDGHLTEAGGRVVAEAIASKWPDLLRVDP